MTVWTRPSASTVDRRVPARQAFRIPYDLWFPLLVYALTRAVDAVFIAEQGYPAHLPVDAQGHVLMNSWAFFPLFPVAAGMLSRLTGLGFTTVAPLLNLALGAIAIVVMYRLLS